MISNGRAFWTKVLTGTMTVALATHGALAEPPAKTAADAKTPKSAVKKPDPKFVRLVLDKAGDPQAMETAVVHYVPAKEGDRPGLSVDLVAAVHVGEKSYYDKLNTLFEGYDALLYELVADKNVVPQPGQKARSVVSSIQVGLKSMLDLEFQLDCVDYSKKNFVHADMTPDEMAKSMKERNESLLTIMIRMMGAGMAQNGAQNTSEIDLIMALLDKNRAVQMKRFMATQMDDMDGLTAALAGPKGSTLITERNKAALKVLTDEIKSGKKKIAIFYGGGHLVDMEQRLFNEFGLKRDGEQWLEAWNLRLPGKDGKTGK